jgi:hypothetical protein
MNWLHLKDAFNDELTKIAEVSLRGLSPESVMDGSEPLPASESAGFQKARSILELAASQTKTAARVNPQHPGLGKLMKAEDNSTSESAKSVAGYGLAGLGSGTAIHRVHASMPKVFESTNSPHLSAGKRFAANARVNGIGNKLMIGGAAAGLGYGALRAHKRNKAKQMEKKSGIPSPGIALRSTQQVGKIKNVIHAGKGIKSQIPTIGRKGL